MLIFLRDKNCAQEKVQKSRKKSHNMYKTWRKKLYEQFKCIKLWFLHTNLKILCKLRKILCARCKPRPWYFETLCEDLHFPWTQCGIKIQGLLQQLIGAHTSPQDSVRSFAVVVSSSHGFFRLSVSLYSVDKLSSVKLTCQVDVGPSKSHIVTD